MNEVMAVPCRKETLYARYFQKVCVHFVSSVVSARAFGDHVVVLNILQWFDAKALFRIFDCVLDTEGTLVSGTLKNYIEDRRRKISTMSCRERSWNRFPK